MKPIKVWRPEVRQLVYKLGGREFPELDCFGFHRWLVHKESGVWRDLFGGVESLTAATRALMRERISGRWREVGKPSPQGWVGEPEQPLDLVLMFGIVGRGATARAAPLHCGTVVADGLMADFSEEDGVLVRAFRDTSVQRAHPNVATRVLGVYRPAGEG